MDNTCIYIGIDDTDNKESRGTGFRARKMASLIVNEKIGKVISITRHQLFIDPRIPYTSQNSSACLEVYAEDVEFLKVFCSRFLLEDSAVGSDVGLCIAKEKQVNDEIINWGKKAKNTFLVKQDAYLLAQNNNIYLKGLTGTKDGIIGALAAVGLRFSGNDGRFIWIEDKNLRELNGIFQAGVLLNLNVINQIESVVNKIITNSERIFLGNWVRPVLINNKRTLIVEKSNNINNYEWKVASKDYIKSISQ